VVVDQPAINALQCFIKRITRTHRGVRKQVYARGRNNRLLSTGRCTRRRIRACIDTGPAIEGAS
jgi:hypothetical protein